MKRTIFINVHVKLIDSFNHFNALRGKGGSFHRYHTPSYLKRIQPSHKTTGLASDFVRQFVVREEVTWRRLIWRLIEQDEERFYHTLRSYETDEDWGSIERHIIVLNVDNSCKSTWTTMDQCCCINMDLNSFWSSSSRWRHRHSEDLTQSTLYLYCCGLWSKFHRLAMLHKVGWIERECQRRKFFCRWIDQRLSKYVLPLYLSAAPKM